MAPVSRYNNDGGIPCDDFIEYHRQCAAGEFDLVAIGRALLADPQWIMKAREGRHMKMESLKSEDLLKML